MNGKQILELNSSNKVISINLYKFADSIKTLSIKADNGIVNVIKVLVE